VRRRSQVPDRRKGYQEPPRARDKVRVKGGNRAGSRGVVIAVRGDHIDLILSDGHRVSATTSAITNYSAAARLAWRTMPKRAGRPPDPRKKTRVSLRIVAEVWEQLGRLASEGRIRSREHLVNTLLADALRRMGKAGRPPGTRTLSLVSRLRNRMETGS
jgi:hypothetical protein